MVKDAWKKGLVLVIIVLFVGAGVTSCIADINIKSSDDFNVNSIKNLKGQQTCMNNPPVAVDDSYGTVEDTVLDVAEPGVLGNDYDADGDPLTAVLDDDVSDGTLDLNSDGSFSYMPDENFTGTDSFTYHANDGLLDSNVATVVITVTGGSDPPVAVDDYYDAVEDTLLFVVAPGVLYNDYDADGDPLTAVLDDDVSDGTLTLNSDGSFSYTPDENFTGTDSFTYHANDGLLDSNVATVTITVGDVNDPPVAYNDTYNTNEDESLYVLVPGVLFNDIDVDGDSLFAILDTGVSNGTLNLYSNGSFSYAPNANYSGEDTFTYKANDSIYESNIATVTINVSEVNDPPFEPNNPVPDNHSTDIDINADISWEGGDPENDTVTYDIYFGTSSSPPKKVSNHSNTTYDPGTMDGHTQYYWQIVAWDNHGNYTEGPVWDFTTENLPPNTPSNPSPEDGAEDVDVNADLSWTCSDPEDDDLTYDVYFEADDTSPDVLVSSNQTGTTYDPGTMDYDTDYYWMIVAWDEYGASTSGPVWSFTTGEFPNDPPNSPSDPSPYYKERNVSVDTFLSWNCSDPDGDPIVYDVYLEKDDFTPDVLVSDDQIGTTFDPEGLEYDTVYYWQIVAKDNHSATTEGPIWSFVTEEPIPDLNCGGSLSWNDVPVDTIVTGNIYVENIGDPTSLLDWEIESYPDWGTWKFIPSSGTGLTPSMGSISIVVEVVAPDEKNEEFTGEVKIVNSENSSDYCIIDVSLATPKSKPFIQNFPLLSWLIERFPLLQRLLIALEVYVV